MQGSEQVKSLLGPLSQRRWAPSGSRWCWARSAPLQTTGYPAGCCFCGANTSPT